MDYVDSLLVRVHDFSRFSKQRFACTLCSVNLLLSWKASKPVLLSVCGSYPCMTAAAQFRICVRYVGEP